MEKNEKEEQEKKARYQEFLKERIVYAGWWVNFSIMVVALELSCLFMLIPLLMSASYVSEAVVSILDSVWTWMLIATVLTGWGGCAAAHRKGVYQGKYKDSESLVVPIAAAIVAGTFLGSLFDD